MKPTRCCVLTLKGTRCANEPSPVRSTRMIGPVEIAACGLDGHQRAMRSLPDFVRHDAYCGAVGCDRPSNAGICPKHRDMYRDFGITEHMLLATQEAPMPTTPEAQEAQTKPPAAPQDAADGGAIPSPEAAPDDAMWRPLTAAEVEAAMDKVMPLDVPAEVTTGIRDRATAPGTDGESDGEPSEGDVADAPLFVGGTDSVPLDGLAALAARGQTVELVRPSDYQTTDGLLSAILGPRQDIPTLAEVQAELARERERADRAEMDAVAERARADEALESLEELRNMRSGMREELHAVCLLMQRLGSCGSDASAMLMRLLPMESRRALLEIEAADARGELARARANVVSPPTPEKLAEYAARVAEVEARIAALDAGEAR